MLRISIRKKEKMFPKKMATRKILTGREAVAFLLLESIIFFMVIFMVNDFA